MKKVKFMIFFVLLFMIIGIATVTTNLIINGTVSVAKNPDDFLVYFSDVKVNGIQDLSLVESKTKLVFKGEFSAIGDKKVISYDVTNASKNYDAELTISCTESTEYLTIINSLDTSINLAATSSRTGTLTIELSNAVSEEISQSVTCTISASAVERTSQGSGSVVAPVEKQLAIGDELSIGKEIFNVISITDKTVTMLAQFNLGTDYRQSETNNTVIFNGIDGWEYTPGPKEIDIQYWSTNPKVYVNNYVSFLQSETGDNSLSGDLITLSQLGDLGCMVSGDYSSGISGCTSSEHREWLINGQYWWTRSAFSGESGKVWVMIDDGFLGSAGCASAHGVRPVITVSREIAEQLRNVYPLGEELSIGNEKFNVISDNGTTVSMLAQQNISGTSPYKQTTEESLFYFSNSSGWEYTPGPKEIDIQTWGGDTKTMLNNYVSYLSTQYDVSVTGDLITLSQLGDLDCTVPSNYYYDLGFTCVDSKYSEWLVISKFWWTKSANSKFANDIWIVRDDGILVTSSFNNYYTGGVRPVITISKSYFE